MAKKHPFAVGAALGAVIATSAALFFTQTTAGKKMVKDAKKEATHLGKEVAKKAQKVKTLTKKKYDDIVDDVVKEYAAKKKLAEGEAKKVKTELKKKWTQVKKEL